MHSSRVIVWLIALLAIPTQSLAASTAQIYDSSGILQYGTTYQITAAEVNVITEVIVIDPTTCNGAPAVQLNVGGTFVAGNKLPNGGTNIPLNAGVHNVYLGAAGGNLTYNLIANCKVWVSFYRMQ